MTLHTATIDSSTEGDPTGMILSPPLDVPQMDLLGITGLVTASQVAPV